MVAIGANRMPWVCSRSKQKRSRQTDRYFDRSDEVFDVAGQALGFEGDLLQRCERQTRLIAEMLETFAARVLGVYTSQRVGGCARAGRRSSVAGRIGQGQPVRGEPELGLRAVVISNQSERRRFAASI